MENKTKLRLLYLYQYLVQHTDAEHPQSTPELIQILKDRYHMPVARNTISNDLIMLHDAGLHIEHYASNQNRYYYDGQVYDLAELKVLTDAIASSKFITEKKSEELIARLLTLTNEHSAAELRRHVCVPGRVKSDNENGYYIVDAINEAIDRKKKIRFAYTDFDIFKQRYAANDGASYTVSPYTLIWDGDYYYMRGFCDERSAMRNFRVDRIEKQPEVLNEAAVPAPADYDPAEYHNAVFRMYDTDEPEEVELLCDLSTMKYVIDHFGQSVPTEPVDDTHFRARVRVCTSATFYRWIFGFEKKIRILGPEPVLKEYRTRLRNALEE